MRMEIFTRLNLGDQGNVDAGDKFSAGSWIYLRAKPGGGAKTGTGSGTLLARMGDAKRKGGAGWEIYQEAGTFTVNLVPETEAPAPAVAITAPVKPADKPLAETIAAVTTPAADAPKPPAAKKPAAAAKMAAVPPGRHAISVVTKMAYPRDEWVHVFFTYDGSRKAAGVKVYVNGKLAETEVKSDTLAAKDSILFKRPLLPPGAPLYPAPHAAWLFADDPAFDDVVLGFFFVWHYSTSHSFSFPVRSFGVCSLSSHPMNDFSLTFINFSNSFF
jgi:hypothetical protein